MDRRVEERIRVLAGQVAGELGFHVVDVRLVGQGRRISLKVFIDKEGGVTLDDCETFSRSLEGLMDVEDPIRGPYSLEVSSPGIDRPLKTLEDFRKNLGKLLRVVTRGMIDKQSFFLGRLQEVREGSVVLSLSGKKDSTKEIEIPFAMIAKAQIEIEVG
jgi:ribosome maturation factor RimP